MNRLERVWSAHRAGCVVGLTLALASGAAWAQEAEDTEAPPDSTATPEAPTSGTASPPVNPAAPTVDVTAPATEPEQAPPEQAPPEQAPEQTTPEQAPPETPPPALSWTLFVDTSYSYSSSHSGTPVAAHRAWETTSGNRLTNNGFNLHWLGLDAAYDAGEIGATGSLRFGTAVPVYYGGNKSDLGIENLTQAYVTWKPLDRLKLDLGQFDTIYGAEVSESWKNLNYSRGGLYFAMQPFFHTGLRASYGVSDALNLTALVVDGVNSVVDDNDKPSLGLQLGITPNHAFSLNVGYLGALAPSTDSDAFSHFFDLVATLNVGNLKLILNGDYDITRYGKTKADGSLASASFFGISAAAGYALCPKLGLALRYEYLRDSDNTLYVASAPRGRPVSVDTLTGTIDLKPLSGKSNFVIRWDNRFESSNTKIYFDKESRASDTWFASILGVVVTTGS